MMSCGENKCGCGPVFVQPRNGAGPTNLDEELVLAEEFGEPSESGVYGAEVQE